MVQAKRERPVEVEIVANLVARLEAIGRRLADPKMPAVERARLARRLRRIDHVLTVRSLEEDETTGGRLYLRDVVDGLASSKPMHWHDYSDGSDTPVRDSDRELFGVLRLSNYFQLRKSLDPKVVRAAIDAWRNGPRSRARTSKWVTFTALANAIDEARGGFANVVNAIGDGKDISDGETLKKFFARHDRGT